MMGTFLYHVAVQKKCFHGKENRCGWHYPPGSARGRGEAMPDRILCILDMDNGYLAFASSTKNYYGVAFTGLKGKTLYPMVSAVWGHCEIKMIYLGSLPRRNFVFTD